MRGLPNEQLLRHELSQQTTVLPSGEVREVSGLTIRATLPGGRVGDIVLVHRGQGELKAEITGFSGADVILAPLGQLYGIRFGDRVSSTGAPLKVSVSESMLGVVVDGLGQPFEQVFLDGATSVEVDRRAPRALERQRVTHVLPTKVKIIDSLCTIAEGQRVGIFAGSGTGKSTLMSMLARGVEADVVVFALIGERGREVLERLDDLGAARERSVMVAATSDDPPLVRARAAQVAMTIAEWHRDRGKKVLLIVDSLTRYARALREVALASGEPPARRGYPPSVFAELPRYVERAGAMKTGSITALFTVLVESGDLEEPVADEVRGILDGHIVLDRELGARGHWPAVEPTLSLSRVMDRVVSTEHKDLAQQLRARFAALASKRDLIALGAYQKGSDPLVDQALTQQADILRFVTQQPNEQFGFDDTLNALRSLMQPRNAAKGVAGSPRKS